MPAFLKRDWISVLEPRVLDRLPVQSDTRPAKSSFLQNRTLRGFLHVLGGTSTTISPSRIRATIRAPGSANVRLSSGRNPRVPYPGG